MILLDVLRQRHEGARVPLWFMRQAGRTLPEYMELRKKAGSFETMCLTTTYAVEATLQPIRRWDVDAAILFSDILMVPWALGQKMTMVEDKGPSLDRDFFEKPLQWEERILLEKWGPIFEAVREVRRQLAPEKTLIGFAGGPWTVATYMVEGVKSKDHAPVKAYAWADIGRFDRLIEALTEITYLFVRGQIEGGAQVIQLFESWAGVLPEPYFEKWVKKPLLALASWVRRDYPGVPVILFPRGAGSFYAHLMSPDVAGLSLDSTLSLDHVVQCWGGRVALQGGLDPTFLKTPLVEKEVKRLLETMRGLPYIFNLSHGLAPDTPLEGIARAIKAVRQWEQA